MHPGDIFLTRNTEAVGNESPGHWNHAAIVAVDGNVIEAQSSIINAVIKVEATSFTARYPEYILLQFWNATKAYSAARCAEEAIGTTYRKVASIFRNLRNQNRGENCVSVVRKAYRDAMGIDPRWRIPDHIYEEVENKNFTIVHHHQDYERWKEPADRYSGRIW